MNVIGRFLILVFFLGCSPTWAEWQLVPDKSHLSFVSTKKQHIAESHTFKGLQGSVDNDSVGTVAVDLASVDTKIEIRDERMRETLFETKEYPTAVFTTHVDPMRVRSISEWPPGDQQTMFLEGELSLHGSKHPIGADVIVTKSGVNRVQVASARPVIIQAENFNLVQGIIKLAEIAGLPSISHAVPVNFLLTFDVITP